MSCSSSNNLGIALTFFLTAIFSSIITLLLTLLFVRVYIKRNELTRKEPVEPVEHDPYKEMQSPSVNSLVSLYTNLAYEFIDQQ